MDTETLDNTSTSLEELEEPEDVSEQEENVVREEEAKEPEEEINEEEEEEPRSERFKAQDNMIVDIESASEDDADGDTAKPQEDHDHQSDSVKSEGGCQVSDHSPVVLYTPVTCWVMCCRYNCPSKSSPSTEWSPKCHLSHSPVSDVLASKHLGAQ